MATQNNTRSEQLAELDKLFANKLPNRNNTAASTTTTQTKTTKSTEDNNKNSALGVLARGAAQILPSVGKGLTSAIDDIVDAPASISNYFQQKEAATADTAANRLKSQASQARYDKAKSTHALGEGIQNWESKVDAAQQAIMEDNPDSKLAEIAYKGTELAESAGRMLPTIAVSAATGGILGAATGATSAGAAGAAVVKAVSTASQAAGLATMGAEVYSRSMKDSIDQGASVVDAGNKAFLDAGLEIGTEMMFGGIQALGKSGWVGAVSKSKPMQTIRTAVGDTKAGAILGGIASKASTFANSKIGKTLIGDVVNGEEFGGILGEAIEEMVSEFVSPFIERATTNPDAEDATLGQILEAGLGGAILSAVMGPLGTVQENIQTKKFEKAIVDWTKTDPQNILALQTTVANDGITGKIQMDSVQSFTDFALLKDMQSLTAFDTDLRKIFSDSVEQNTIDGKITRDGYNNINAVFLDCLKGQTIRNMERAAAGDYKNVFDTLVSTNETVKAKTQEYEDAKARLKELSQNENLSAKQVAEVNELQKKITDVTKELAEAQKTTVASINLEIEQAYKDGTVEAKFGKDIADMVAEYKSLNVEGYQEYQTASAEVDRLANELATTRNTTAEDIRKQIEASYNNGTLAKDFGSEVSFAYESMKNAEDPSSRVVLPNYKDRGTSIEVGPAERSYNKDELSKALYKGLSYQEISQNDLAEDFAADIDMRFDKVREDIRQVQLETADEINAELKKQGSTLSVSYAHIPYSTPAYYEDGKIIFNADVVATRNQAYYYLGHEIVHNVFDTYRQAKDFTALKKFQDDMDFAMVYSGFNKAEWSTVVGEKYMPVYFQEELIKLKDANLSQDEKTAIAVANTKARWFGGEYTTIGEKNTKQTSKIEGEGSEEIYGKFMSYAFSTKSVLDAIGSNYKTLIEASSLQAQRSALRGIKNKGFARAQAQLTSDLASALAYKPSDVLHSTDVAASAKADIIINYPPEYNGDYYPYNPEMDPYESIGWNTKQWGDYWAETLPIVTEGIDLITNEVFTLSKAMSKLASRTHPIMRNADNQIKVQYHGTTSNPFNEFSRERSYNRGVFTSPDGEFVLKHYTTHDVEFVPGEDGVTMVYADGKPIAATEEEAGGFFRLYSIVSNPIIIDAREKRYNAIPMTAVLDDFSDGAVTRPSLEPNVEPYEFSMLTPKQITEIATAVSTTSFVKDMDAQTFINDVNEFASMAFNDPDVDLVELAMGNEDNSALKLVNSWIVETSDTKAIKRLQNLEMDVNLLSGVQYQIIPKGKSYYVILQGHYLDVEDTIGRSLSPNWKEWEHLFDDNLIEEYVPSRTTDVSADDIAIMRSEGDYYDAFAGGTSIDNLYVPARLLGKDAVYVWNISGGEKIHDEVVNEYDISKSIYNKKPNLNNANVMRDITFGDETFEDTPNNRAVNSEKMYSRIVKAFERRSPDSIINLDKQSVIRYLTKPSVGISYDEIRTSGLIPLLESEKKSMTRDELIDYLKRHQLAYIENLEFNESEAGYRGGYQSYATPDGIPGTYSEYTYVQPGLSYANDNRHWSTDGVALHVREQDFVSTNNPNEIATVIEEVQSDPVSDAREGAGYASGDEQNRINELRTGLSEQANKQIRLSNELRFLEFQLENLTRTGRNKKTYRPDTAPQVVLKAAQNVLDHWKETGRHKSATIQTALTALQSNDVIRNSIKNKRFDKTNWYTKGLTSAQCNHLRYYLFYEKSVVTEESQSRIQELKNSIDEVSAKIRDIVAARDDIRIELEELSKKVPHLYHEDADATYYGVKKIIEHAINNGNNVVAVSTPEMQSKRYGLWKFGNYTKDNKPDNAFTRAIIQALKKKAFAEGIGMNAVKTATLLVPPGVDPIGYSIEELFSNGSRIRVGYIAHDGGYAILDTPELKSIVDTTLPEIDSQLELQSVASIAPLDGYENVYGRIIPGYLKKYGAQWGAEFVDNYQISDEVASTNVLDSSRKVIDLLLQDHMLTNDNIRELELSTSSQVRQYYVEALAYITNTSVPTLPFHVYDRTLLDEMSAETGEITREDFSIQIIDNKRGRLCFNQSFRAAQDETGNMVIQTLGEPVIPKDAFGSTYTLPALIMNDTMMADIKKNGQRRYYDVTDSNAELARQWQEAQAKYGTFEEGGVPKQVVDNKKVSKFSQSLYSDPQNAAITPEIRKLVLDGSTSYTPLKDITAEKGAHAWLGKYEKVDNAGNISIDIVKACSDYIEAGQRGENQNKGAIVRGELLLSTLRGNGQMTDEQLNLWSKVAASLAADAPKAGQTVQAYSLLKKLTPDGRLFYIQRCLETLREDLKARQNSIFGGAKKVANSLDNYQIPQEYLDQLAAAKTVDELDAAEQNIINSIADAIPPTLGTRMMAWRYLSMLGNVRTHERNIISNAAMYAAKNLKDTTAGIAEDIFIGKKGERTKTAKKASAEAVEFANNDWNVMKDVMTFGGKMGFDTKVSQARKSYGDSFAGKALEKTSKWNGDLLESEDAYFLRLNYRKSLANYITANNLSIEFLNSNTAQALETLGKARDYAVREAQKATYREANSLSNYLNKIERSSPVAELLVGGLVPFKRTPMNVLKRGLEYSPIGIVTGVKELVLDVNSGKVTVAEGIDKLCSGLTGTMILMLGLFLGGAGIMKAGGSDDDTSEYYDQMLGNQKYSITIGDKNYTLDWLTPLSMPLFAGVTLTQALGETDGEDIDFNDLLTAIGSMTDPLTNLSLLQGVNDALSAYGDSNKLLKLAVSSAESYASQFIPTLAGQVARTIDPTRRSTYAPKDSTAIGGSEGEKFINRLKSKLPFLSESNEAYIDMWGRTEERSDNILARAAEQMIAPWYTKESNITDVDYQILELFEKTEDKGIYPSTPNSYYNIGGETMYLSSQDYTEKKITVGQLSYEGVDTFFDSTLHNYLNADEQAEVLSEIYSYANSYAKAQYAEANNIQDFKPDSNIAKIEAAQAVGLTIGDYYAIKKLLAGVEGDKNAKGKTISGSVKKNKQALLKAYGLTDEQMEIFL